MVIGTTTPFPERRTDVTGTVITFLHRNSRVTVVLMIVAVVDTLIVAAVRL